MALSPEIATGIRIQRPPSSEFSGTTSEQSKNSKWIKYLNQIIKTRSSLPEDYRWQMPDELKKQVLVEKLKTEGSLDPKLWLDRSNETERGVKKIIEAQTKIVKEVTMNMLYAPGSDMEVFFIEGFPIDKVKVEVKSSYKAVGAYHRKIRDDLIEAGELGADEWYGLTDREREVRTKTWLTKNNIILVNGGIDKNGQEKTDDEILYDSFYPQLLRVLEYKTSGLINIH